MPVAARRSPRCLRPALRPLVLSLALVVELAPARLDLALDPRRGRSPRPPSPGAHARDGAGPPRGRVSSLFVFVQADTGAGLVDQVDRLVEEEAVADVAVGELRRGDDRLVGDSDRWKASYQSLRPWRVSIVSSTVGSRTNTGWKRRSSAGSFSMFLRYSSSVVAPITWSSPRSGAGLSMFDASMAPSAAPAPTTVYSSSINRIRSLRPRAPRRSVLSRSSNSPRYFVRAIIPARSTATSRLFVSVSGTSSLTMRCAIPSTLVFPAGLAQKRRVVLRPVARGSRSSGRSRRRAR